MAQVTYEDLVEGNSGSLISRKGWTFTRLYKVSGLDGDGYNRVKQAVEQPEIPGLGDPHPSVNTVIVQRIDCVSNSHDVVELAVKYAAPDYTIPSKDEVVVNVGTTLSQTETNLDAFGNIMFTAYTYPDEYKETPGWENNYIPHGALINKLIPQSTLEMTRQENDSPLVLSSIYTGKINSQVFQGGNPGTWMCMNISGNSLDGGDTYTVTYSFQFREDNWNQDVVFISSDTGEPPIFDTPENIASGMKTYQIYTAIDFNQLGLPNLT
jgi:hypothetical protein